MNRRKLASLTLVLAVALYAFPFVSPVPVQEPKLGVDAGDNPSAQPYNFTNGTVHYDQLSPAAQQWFDSAPSTDQIHPENTVPLDSPPEPWATFVANNTPTDLSDMTTLVQVVKNDQYYLVTLVRITPKPSQQAVILRLGSLIGAIVLFGLAGHLFLTGRR